MRGGGRVPRELVPRPRGATPRGRERGGITEQLSERGPEAGQVTRRDDPTRLERTHDLAEPTDVVDDRGDSGAERLQERAGLVELRGLRKDGDGRVRQRALERRAVEVPEAPLGPCAGPPAQRVERDTGVARHEQACVGDAQDGVDGVGQPLVGADDAEREDRPAVVRTRRSLRNTGWGITRSFASATPNAASVSRPRRSERPHGRSARRASARDGCGWLCVSVGDRAR